MLAMTGALGACTASVQPGAGDKPVSEMPVAGPPLFYPPSLRGQHLLGTATVECVVDQLGGTQDCTVVESTGPAFGEEAKAYVSDSRYLPEVMNGKPVAARHRWTIAFDPDRPGPEPEPHGPPQPKAPYAPFSGVALAYPSDLLRQHKEAVVKVEGLVTTEGKVTDCVILDDGGEPEFGESACEYVTHARYSPATHHGVPIPTWHRWEIAYTLS